MSEDKGGPLVIPLAATSGEAYTAVHTKLRGHATSDRWLPEGLTPELDEIRAEQLGVRGRVVEELAAMADLDNRFSEEDQEYGQELRQAQREGRRLGKDKRTPPEKRQQERELIQDHVRAGVMVLAEVVDAAYDYLEQHEAELLAQLNLQRVPAQEKRIEAQRLLDEAWVEEWLLAQQAIWLKKVSDARGVFGAQPAPKPTPPPRDLSRQMLNQAFERPWPQQQGALDEPMKPWQESQTPQTEDEPLGDPSGVVSALNEAHA